MQLPSRITKLIRAVKYNTTTDSLNELNNK